MEFTLTHLAFKEDQLPTSPIPFLNALQTGVRNKGNDFIRTPPAQMLLLTLIKQSYGEFFSLDAIDETFRLIGIVNTNQQQPTKPAE